jgi:hypothetical protein
VQHISPSHPEFRNRKSGKNQALKKKSGACIILYERYFWHATLLESLMLNKGCD